MVKVTVKHNLGWFYLSIALVGMGIIVFSDTTAGLLVVMLAFLGKIIENTDTLIQELKGTNNE